MHVHLYVFEIGTILLSGIVCQDLGAAVLLLQLISELIALIWNSGAKQRVFASSDDRFLFTVYK